MNTITRIIVICFLSVAILGCSRKKNSFLNRNYHAVTAEYNTLYNGNIALDLGRREINQNYADNYWDILPVERMNIDENILLPDSVRNQNFGRAEEKAVKAIQKHSMQLEGKERNPQIDEAYLLLGKARYFDQRFVPALDAFNYILFRYPASDNIDHAKVWREKTNLRLGNDRLALKNLRKLLESPRMEDEDIADASSALAQAYINLNLLDSAVAPLYDASQLTRNDEEKGRYFYILGQLHNRLGEPQNANQAFDEVIALNRKSPRIYMINAYVEKARNHDLSSGNNEQLLTLLTELENDRENRPFLDKIYFQIGEYYSKIDSTEKAISFYNRSLRSPSSDIYLKSVNYEILANINFDRANYQAAGKYYDSTLTYMSPELLEYRSLKKKREKLEGVIQYENVLAQTDSIFRLVNMTEDERMIYFQSYTDTLRSRAVAQMEAGLVPVYTANIGRPSAFPQANSMPPADPNSANIFYFYNPIRVSRGAQEFLRTWGPRELQDNWRYAATSAGQTVVNAQEKIMDVNLDNDPLYDPMTYVNKIPSDTFILDSLATQRNLANYQLGLIYNENYGEYDLASQRLEFLLGSLPEERLILPTKYNLYKIYQSQGLTGKMEAMRADILTKHPDSRYAAFIRNPEEFQENMNSPDILYNELYKKYEAQEYETVITETNNYIATLTGDPIVPKLELLKAQANARLLGLDAYRQSLNYVALTYPQSKEGQKAQDILNTSLPSLQQLEFNKDSLQNNFKILYEIDSEETLIAEELKQKITKAIYDLGYSDMSVSIDLYDRDQIFVVIHGLQNESQALGFTELLQNNKNYNLSTKSLVISSENYKIVQIKKNLREFLSLN